MSNKSILTNLEVMAFFFGEMAYFNQKNPHHQFDVLRHCRVAYLEAALMELPAEVQLAAMFHDVGKLWCYHDDEDGVRHFYTEENGKRFRHEDRGADTDCLWDAIHAFGLDDTTIQRARWYVRHHGDTIAPTKKALNRIVNKIIKEATDNKIDFFMKESPANITRNLIMLQIADCKAKNANPCQKDIDELTTCLNLLQEMSKEANETRIHDLLITGNEIMRELKLKEGPSVGEVLRHLLDLVKKRDIENTRESLLQAVKDLKTSNFVCC